MIIALTYRLPTPILTLTEVNNELLGIDHHKQRLQKLWHETRDPACKTALDWFTKTIRRITWKKASKRWETKLSKCEVTPHAIWCLAKSVMKRYRPKAPTAIHGPSCLRFLLLEKANSKKAFDSIWHPGLLYELSKLHFWSSLIA
jgi:hypothetical protein